LIDLKRLGRIAWNSHCAAIEASEKRSDECHARWTEDQDTLSSHARFLKKSRGASSPEVEFSVGQDRVLFEAAIKKGEGWTIGVAPSAMAENIDERYGCKARLWAHCQQ
jgi:hypothetical protein